MVTITPTLEKTLLNFASFASLRGRSEYANILRDTLLMPEPKRSEQLDILKYSIAEILTISKDEQDFKDFVRKYDFTANSLKEFLRFLGPNSGLNYYPEDEKEEYITISSYLRTKVDEQLFDKIVLFFKLEFGKKYWEELEYKELNNDKLNDILAKTYAKSPLLAEYLNNVIKINV